VDEWLSGGIASLSLITASQILVTVKDAVGLDNPLLLSDSTLLCGTTIVIYKNDGTVAYEETIDSTAGVPAIVGIIVNVGNQADWNIDGSRTAGIDTGYSWEIDASACGMTNSTVYEEFITHVSRLAEDAVAGTMTVKVDDPGSFPVSSSVELVDSNGSTQLTSVDSKSGSMLILADPLDRTYAVAWGAAIRLRQDSFAGDHVHSIRDGEVETVDVSQFAEAGYPRSHNHVMADKISNVACLRVDESGKIFAGGSSNIVFSSLDDGESWQEEIDIDSLSNDTTSCQQATCMEVDFTGKTAIGTGCGFIVYQAVDSDMGGEPIEIPVIEESSSSSSSSSSSRIKGTSSSSRSSQSSPSSQSSQSSQSSLSSLSSKSSSKSSLSSPSSPLSSLSSESSSLSSVSSISTPSSTYSVHP